VWTIRQEQKGIGNKKVMETKMEFLRKVSTIWITSEWKAVNEIS